jgi:hypothetical protein
MFKQYFALDPDILSKIRLAIIVDMNVVVVVIKEIKSKGNGRLNSASGR